MWIQQVFVACLCILLGLQQSTAVVNNGQKSSEFANAANSTNDNDANDSNTESNATVADSIAESSEGKTSRREAPPGFSGAYGAPVPSGSYGLPFKDSYVPSSPSNIGLPVPVYGAPDAPSNNIVYPGPPPDIPPPIHGISGGYGPPKDVYGPPAISLPPIKYGPPRPVKPPFSLPSLSLPKPVYGPPLLPKPQYGPPPKPVYLPPKFPKPTYGLPIKLSKPYYGPPKPLYVPSKPLSTYGPPATYVNIRPLDLYIPPKPSFSPPKGVYGPPPLQYGPPEPIPHGPPHPGVPAPPTPPDIKYDGWQPIPGLVSRPPQPTYGVPGVPHAQPHGHNDFHLNTDFVPPPSGHGHKGGLSDSYGAPLNTVTGSGGIVSDSGDHHSNLGSFGVSGSGGHGSNGLSVIKSIGYEIVPQSGNPVGGQGHLTDSYGAPPLNSYAPNGPYAAAHSYDNSAISSFATLDNFAQSIAATFDTTLGSSSLGHDAGIGLIPPSGVYGVPPSGQYGTPLLSPPPKYNPPKHPVLFRDPVPPGLFESIGNSVVQKDAQGIIESAHNHYAGPTYVPPPVQDVSKPVREHEPTGPSNLYTLPNKNPISFHSFVQGSGGFNGGFDGGFTSYNAPLGSVDGAYALPQTGGLSVGLTTPHIDSFGSHTFTSNNFASSFNTPYFSGYQGHDCSQKSQPVPSLSFGVPAANTYTASLASLNTNLAGAYQGPHPQDLQASHSQSTSTVNEVSGSDFLEDEKQAEVTGKSLAEGFGAGAELIKSQSVDLNNIPVQGALGSYTLQIQSADGSGSIANVPHHQVLNDGLLQSILNAIEQPQQNTAAILSQPLLHLQQIPPQSHSLEQQLPSGSGQIFSGVQDSEADHSVMENVIITPPNGGAVKEGKKENIPLIDNNEIALYFSNNGVSTGANGSDKDEKQNELFEGVRNGQQYGSYVAFETPNSSFVYGNLRSSNSTLESNSKTDRNE